MKQFFLASIRFYQKHLSLRRFVRVCRFTPSCSEYTYQAINKYGTIKGIVMGAGRIMRCHPWNEGGYDPLK